MNDPASPSAATNASPSRKSSAIARRRSWRLLGGNSWLMSASSNGTWFTWWGSVHGSQRRRCVATACHQCHNRSLIPKLIPTLRSNEYFGQYGKISKILITKRTPPGGTGPVIGLYITYTRREDAARAIAAVDGAPSPGGGREIMRASYGTTKYCMAFLRNVSCNDHNCMNLHEWGDEKDCFTKEDLTTLSVPFSWLFCHLLTLQYSKHTMKATENRIKTSTVTKKADEDGMRLNPIDQAIVLIFRQRRFLVQPHGVRKALYQPRHRPRSVTLSRSDNRGETLANVRLEQNLRLLNQEPQQSARQQEQRAQRLQDRRLLALPPFPRDRLSLPRQLLRRQNLFLSLRRRSWRR